MTSLIELVQSLLPRRLKRLLSERRALRNIISNTGWLLTERVAKMGVGLFIIVWMARYLGVERFGLYNFSLAFVALFSQLTTLGLEGIIIRDLVEKPNKQADILGTSFLMRLVGGLLSLSLATSLIFLLRPGDTTALLFIAILSCGNIFRALESVDYYFQARVEAKFIVIVKLCVLAFSSFSTVLLIVFNADLIFFVSLKALETVLINGGLLLSYLLRREQVAYWHFDQARAKTLLRQSWPLILSGFGSIIYLKLDQVMLGQMVGNSAVGIYSVAAQLSELWYFIPFAVVSSVFPSLVKGKAQSEELYQSRLQKLYNLLFISSLAISVPVALLSGPVVSLLYGKDYQAAGSILSIHVWASVFIFMRAALSKWLIVENLFIFSLVTHSFGAIVNVALNLILIPRYSGLGAAFATLVSYATASYFALFLHPRTWPAAIMMTRALLFPLQEVTKRVSSKV